MNGEADGRTGATKRKFNSNVKECLKGGKTNAFTQGFITFLTSIKFMNRHESTPDHAAYVLDVNLKADMQKAMKRVDECEDQFIYKLLKQRRISIMN